MALKKLLTFARKLDSPAGRRLPSEAQTALHTALDALVAEVRALRYSR